MNDVQIKNVFCDRDGTVIYDRHYLSDPDGVELLPGAAEGLGRLAASGKAVFVVTNQSGIGRGMFGTPDYLACHRRMIKLLEKERISVSGSAFCPHAPEEGCLCRKPETGMWERLSREHGLVARECVMIGDKPEDILFGRNAGFAATVLVLTGKGRDSAVRLGLPELPEGASYLRLDDGLSDPLSGSAPREGWPDCLAADLSGAAAFVLDCLEGGNG